MLKVIVGTTLLLMLGGCGENARLTVQEGSGAKPKLPPPSSSWLPRVNIAPVVGWKGDEQPRPAPGLAVNAFASGLDHPRWLLALPNGDVLVAEASAPPQPEDREGVYGMAMDWIMQRAGAVVPSANRITLLRDTDGDGHADVHLAFIEGLHSPFGMALIGSDLYIAETDALRKIAYLPDATRLDAPLVKVADLPAGPRNHHWTKNVIASPDGKKLYVTIGSNSNAAENGMDIERDRAAILEVDPATGKYHIFASGLRNPNGLAWHPQTGALWTVVNERDDLGGDLVPDYLTSVIENAFYGWPYSYFGQHVDTRVQPQRPDLVTQARVPDYALGPHTASLGLAFAQGDALPAAYRQGAFVGQHGSWNRDPPSGYKVVFVPFSERTPAGEMRDVLTGFLDDEGRAHGRPVGVVMDTKGALLVADDVGNTVWRVTGAATTP